MKTHRWNVFKTKLHKVINWNSQQRHLPTFSWHRSLEKFLGKYTRNAHAPVLPQYLVSSITNKHKYKTNKDQNTKPIRPYILSDCAIITVAMCSRNLYFIVLYGSERFYWETQLWSIIVATVIRLHLIWLIWQQHQLIMVPISHGNSDFTTTETLKTLKTYWCITKRQEWLWIIKWTMDKFHSAPSVSGSGCC